MAVLILALGIGVNAAIFTFVNVVLFRPLQIPRPAELVGVYNRDTEPPGRYRTFSYPNFRDLSERVTTFSGLTAYTPTMVGLEQDGVTRRVMTYTVSDSYFKPSATRSPPDAAFSSRKARRTPTSRSPSSATTSGIGVDANAARSGERSEATGGWRRGGAGRARAFSGRNELVVGQLALSLTLLTAGGLFLRGALTAATRNPGFALEHGLLAKTDPSLAGYDETRGRQIYADLLDRLRTVPGIEAVAAASLVPFSGISEGRALEPVGRPDAENDRAAPRFSIITPGYFETVGLPIFRGRDFTAAEVRSDNSPRVVIVDEPLVRRLWPESDPIGQYVAFYDRATEQRDEPLQVVGVVPGLQHEVFDAEPVAHVYMPFGHPYRLSMTIHFRTAGAETAQALVPVMRDAIRAFDPNLPVFALTTLTDYRDGSLELWVIRAGSQVFSTFGLAALRYQ